MRRFCKSNENGYVMVLVLVLFVVALSVVANTLTNVSTSARTAHASKMRGQEFNEAETAVNRVVSWMRSNSQKLVSPFRRDEFYTHFERTAPSVGDNDTTMYAVPTKVKLIGTSDSALLVTDASLGTATFPTTRDLSTGAVFPVSSEFVGAEFGDAMVRVTMVDVIAHDPTKDYGPPPNPAPETDFAPVYRIDTLTGIDRGAHVYGYISTDMNHLFDYGIYGEDYLELRQPCDSYLSADNDYAVGTRRANCPASSNSTSQIHKSEVVYGTLRTNGDINEETPYGGEVCSDFQADCPNEGETCSGEDCGVPLLEQFDEWSVYCPSDQGDVTYNADTTITVAGELPSQKCWNHVKVQSNVTVTLSSTSVPYYIKTLELANNSNSVINIAPDDLTKYVEVYVETIVGNKINGAQALNTANRPYNLRLYYLGTETLTLDGTAEINAALVSPNAAVSVSGNFEFCGALLARRLLLNGSGGVHYDESLAGSGDLSDSQYRLVDLVQNYR